MTEKADIENNQPERTKAKKPLWRRLFKFALISGGVGVVSAALLVLWAIIHYGRDLPDYRQLANYEPSVVTRIHAGDGSLLTEFAREQRLFVPIEAVPEQLIHAFLAAEDKNFYEHSGLDYMGMVRGNLRNVLNVILGRPLQGGSTITQQTARNFLLTLDQRLDRKIKEMILTLRIERAFSKDRILELYLNEIYFGNRSYGVAAAALNYFNKSLNELTIDEMAYLAALPKAPNNYHPVRNRERAMGRRNWVLSRMLVLDYIDADTYREAASQEIVMRKRGGDARFEAGYFAEEVRRRVGRMYGTKVLYEGGLSVRTSLEPRLQAVAERTLRDGLIAYDRRHGWRGPLGRLDVDNVWQERLVTIKTPLGVPSWRHAVVHEVRAEGAVVGLKTGEYGFIPFAEVEWARAWRTGERLGPKIKDIGEVLSMGDVIAVEAIPNSELVAIADFYDIDGTEITLFPQFGLRQIPEIQGALVAMDPHTGRTLAMAGGYDFESSEYNRATQAKRQPGSAFKPFVYAAGLDRDFTPASLVLDAPFVIDQGEGLGKWKPKNSSDKFYGPSTLRLGIEKSRNLMTVRLAQHLGMGTIMDYAKRFNLHENMEPSLAASLGAGEVSLLKLTAAYGMIVNGGKQIQPALIDRIQDRRGRTVYQHDDRVCSACELTWQLNSDEPPVPDNREQILDPLTAYQLVSMMQGVVENGTGRKIRAIGKPLAGKTGTTNDEHDAWFVGFSPDLVVGVFTGFDRPRSLGRGEEGSSVAVPVFRDFMREAMNGQPGVPFRTPSGIRLVRVNAETGAPASVGDARIILEAFKPGTEPRAGQLAVLDGSLPIGKTKSSIRKGTGGIY
ncbi:MAG: penicillin-binding protein 1A [Kordiimonadaceae bacterium]|nr:penicillin-binding protein 1A [Kordiimonadaceae bacterium]MBO6570140.1 penicillin-binding protein 1A [Kordiimonadaceae bacterium]MBO6965762.1 penicillin-binding protein 1A [Kordiimonadaceae bacterium]